MYAVPEPEQWPHAVWSVLRQRGSISWQLYGPVVNGEDADQPPGWSKGYCECWPAQVFDGREQGATVGFAYLDDEDTLPLFGEIGTLTGGWVAKTPREVVHLIAENVVDLLPPLSLLEHHPGHRRAVLHSAFEILTDLARLDGEPVDEDAALKYALMMIAAAD